MQLAGSPGGETLDLNALTGRGARMFGRLAAVRDGRLLFSGSLPNVCRLADLKLDRLLDTLDTWAADTGAGVSEPPERFAPTRVPSPRRSSSTSAAARSAPSSGRPDTGPISHGWSWGCSTPAAG